MSEIGEERKTILIVDDTKDSVLTMKKILESEGFETMESYSGIECLQKLYEAKRKPDLVLLDIMMEPMDGWVTLKTMKCDEKLKEIPVSILTVLPPDEKVIGIDTITKIENYIVKPFTKEEIIEKVAEVFDQIEEMEKVSKALHRKKLQKIANEYEHLVKELHRRNRVVESMQNSLNLDLVGDTRSIKDVLGKQEEMIQVMEDRIKTIREKYEV
ncbi:MAG: response regulator [Halobacteriota archaeon]|nr:response regulator [Halobacteriota archaeon]MDY6958735.1 response regulator [Halobacteriota archaeon]